MESIVIPLRPVLIFVVVLARVGGLVTFAPIWSHKLIPARIRALLALALALVVTPIVEPRLAMPPTNVAALTVVIAAELCIGLLFGLAARLVFGAIEMTAEVVSFQMGFSLESLIDPATKSQTTAIGIAAQLVGTVMLLGMDGHHWLLAATVRSFGHASAGSFHVSAAIVDLLIRLSADAISVGVALAAPAIIILLATEFALAIAGRAAPQIQVLILGFPIKIAVGFWLIGASLFFMPGAIRSTLTAIRTAMTKVLGEL